MRPARAGPTDFLVPLAVEALLMLGAAVVHASREIPRVLGNVVLAGFALFLDAQRFSLHGF